MEVKTGENRESESMIKKWSECGNDEKRKKLVECFYPFFRMGESESVKTQASTREEKKISKTKSE